MPGTLPPLLCPPLARRHRPVPCPTSLAVSSRAQQRAACARVLVWACGAAGVPGAPLSASSLAWPVLGSRTQIPSQGHRPWARCHTWPERWRAEHPSPPESGLLPGLGVRRGGALCRVPAWRLCARLLPLPSAPASLSVWSLCDHVVPGPRFLSAPTGSRRRAQAGGSLL